MLQQVLRDMYVDPEILAELDETQKQTLFCKMREEQVRRWTNWDAKQQNDNNLNTKNYKNRNKPMKTVRFLTGLDDEPWVWVMGEHPEDKTIEEILEEEAREKARKLVEEELNHNNNNNKQNQLKIEDIYCSVIELPKPFENGNYSFYDHSYRPSGDILQEISLNTTVQKVAQKVALWEKKLMEERIFETIQKKHEIAAKEAEEAALNQEALWKEQERKAKQAEQQIREIARKAREEHRLTTTTTRKQDSQSIEKDEPQPNRPPNRDAALDWYRTQEVKRKAAINTITNSFEPWFHGLITRQEAETLLSNQQSGTFLVRLSERIWGYTITYRTEEKCKHYLIDSSNGHYQFLGDNQINHQTLSDLVAYHRKQPLSDGDCLIRACPRSVQSIAYLELLKCLHY